MRCCSLLSAESRSSGFDTGAAPDQLTARSSPVPAPTTPRRIQLPLSPKTCEPLASHVDRPPPALALILLRSPAPSLGVLLGAQYLPTCCDASTSTLRRRANAPICPSVHPSIHSLVLRQTGLRSPNCRRAAGDMGPGRLFECLSYSRCGNPLVGRMLPLSCWGKLSPTPGH